MSTEDADTDADADVVVDVGQLRLLSLRDLQDLEKDLEEIAEEGVGDDEVEVEAEDIAPAA